MIIFKKLDYFIEKMTEYLLTASIMSILFFSFFSIIFRWFHINFSFIEPLVRHLVFFSTFLGGIIATGKGTHICIDLVSKILEAKELHKTQKFLQAFISLTTMGILIWLIKAGVEFSKIEYEFPKVEFFGLSSGLLVSSIPFGLTLMLLRTMSIFILSLNKREEV